MFRLIFIASDSNSAAGEKRRESIYYGVESVKISEKISSRRGRLCRVEFNVYTRGVDGKRERSVVPLYFDEDEESSSAFFERARDILENIQDNSNVRIDCTNNTIEEVPICHA